MPQAGAHSSSTRQPAVYYFVDPGTNARDALDEAHATLEFITQMVGQVPYGQDLSIGGSALTGLNTILQAVQNVLTTASDEYGEQYQRGYEKGLAAGRAAQTPSASPVPKLTEEHASPHRRGRQATA